MIESLPPEVRLLCWEFLSVRDYGSLAMTCRTLEYDRRHSLNPTRFVCIASPTNEDALQRSRILHRKDPILLRLETPLPRKHVSLSSVTELELAMRAPVILSATSFPSVQTITLLGNTRFQEQSQIMGKLFQNIETLVIQGNDHFYWNGHDLRECQALHTLILRDCHLQVPASEASDSRCKSDFLSWIKAPLRNVTIRHVQCSSQTNELCEEATAIAIF